MDEKRISLNFRPLFSQYFCPIVGQKYAQNQPFSVSSDSCVATAYTPLYLLTNTQRPLGSIGYGLEIVENIPIEYDRTITVRSDKLKFLIYDHEEEDGDTVSINFNGQWIADKYAIRHKHKTTETFEVNVVPKVENYLFSKAWNLGGIPPNTLTLEIDDGVGRTRVLTINSDLKKSGGVKIVFDPD